MCDSETGNAELNILLVEAKPEQVSRLKNDIPDCNWVEATAGWITDDSKPPSVEGTAAVIVFARKKQEKHALSLCKKIRQRHEMDGIPLLVAINMYQLTLGNAVRRLLHGHFIILPIEKEALRNKLNDMKSGKS